MRFICLRYLVIVTIMAFPCWGGTAQGNPDVPSAGTNPPPPPSGATKTTVVGVICPTENEAARQQYNNALELQQQGKLGEAKDAYLKAVEQDHRYCDAMDNLGLILRREGDVEQAISWYKRSLSVKPDNAVAHQNLANAYNVQGKTDKALAEYQWLVTNDPKNPEGYYGLGKTYLESGRAKDAVGALVRASELYRQHGSPLLADAYYLLGISYFTQEDYQKAKEYFELTYPGREDDPNTNYFLGLCYLDPTNGDLGKARRYLFKAQDLGVKIPAEVLQALGK